MISNFLVQADYQQQYEKSVADLNLSKIALDQGIVIARSEAAALHDRYLMATFDARRQAEEFHGYDRAYRGGAIGQIEWLGKRGDWQASLAAAEAAREAWGRADERVVRVQVEQQTKISADQEASDRVQLLAQRVGGEPLRAPVSGYIVHCTDRPQDVIDPSQTLFNIFDPRRAYVQAFFEPGAMDKVRIGQSVDLSVEGVSGTLTGRVASIDPNLSRLPEQLTRFFWQHVQWSEYRPVRIALDRVPSDVRDRLYYDAQTRVRIRIHNNWHPFEFVALNRQK